MAGLHAVQAGGDGSCGLADCDCHEFVKPARLLSGVDRHDDDDRPAPMPAPMMVHAVELENLTGLASLKLSAFAVTAGGRTTLTVRVGVLS